MSRKKSSPINCFVLFLIIIGFLAFSILIISLLYLPVNVENAFGKPVTGISYPSRIYYAWLLLSYEADLTTPVNPSAEIQNFHIEVGESAISVIQRLQSEGLIRDAEAMRVYLQYSGYDTSLQAGTHQLSPAMTSIEIANIIQSLNRTTIDFSVLPGWRVEEIAALLPTSGLEITPEQFISAAQQFPAGLSFSDEIPAHTGCEGFLYPGIIQVARTTPVDSLIQSLLINFDKNLSPELKVGFSHQGLTIYQAVTLASIVERESVIDEEMPLIASVYLNRLSQNMKLDADPTVQYALGYQSSSNTWWANPLSADDLAFDSPYNTYLNTGLPPTPIANPGMNALKAVANPESSPYLYFRSACDKSGRHVFAKTYAEHLANACP
ncbi:MAG: endolytic transglycosylase MltG [Anaerolineales bacterium]|nr:endolytic transglycosylase MltG [Anaerolineales bacterium]